MGIFSTFVNAWACLWTLFVTIIFLMPVYRPVTAENMNYAIAFLGAILLAAIAYWYVGGKRWYTGPLIEAEVLVDSDSNGPETGLDKGEIPSSPEVVKT